MDSIISFDHSQSFNQRAWPFSKEITAICGLGNPEGFFMMLTQAGFQVKPIALPDHQTIDNQILDGIAGPIFITAKDAVKLKKTAPYQDLWIVTIRAQYSPNLSTIIMQAIENTDKGKKPIAYQHKPQPCQS